MMPGENEAGLKKTSKPLCVPSKPLLDTWRREGKAGEENIDEAGPTGAPKAETEERVDVSGVPGLPFHL